MVVIDELTRDVFCNEVVEAYKLTFDMDPTEDVIKIRQRLCTIKQIIMDPSSTYVDANTTMQEYKEQHG